jgi:hypothetical protein
MNGLAQQPGPSSGSPITYPFTSYDGRVTFSREQWGNRTFDLNKDGLANYGMYADWLREVQQIGGAPVMRDMFQGAEAYLESWERADGVPAASCRPARERFSARGLGSSLRLGQSSRAALFSAGQPSARPGRVFRYCVGGGHGAVAAVFSARGRVAMIASTARGDVAGGVHPGEPVRHLGRRIRRIAPGVWAGRKLAHGARFVYAVRHGRVQFVAVAPHGKLLPVATAAQLRAAGI